MTRINSTEKKDGILRQIHFVDVDNLTGGPSTDIDVQKDVRQSYLNETGYLKGDLCFVGCSHISAFAVTHVWKGARVYWRSGFNGADEALLKAFDENDLSTFDHIWLGSGDGIFMQCLEQFSMREDVRESCEVSVLALKREDINSSYLSGGIDVHLLDMSVPVGELALTA